MALSPKDTIESPAGDYENRNINITWGTNHKNHKQYLGMMPNWQLLFKNSKLLFKNSNAHPPENSETEHKLQLIQDSNFSSGHFQTMWVWE